MCGKPISNGWGTALKPASEHWILARKPLAGTVAANVAEYGTGAINVDACRIGTSKDVPASASKDRLVQVAKGAERNRTTDTSGFDPNVGRWPANVTLDEEAAAALDEQSGERATSKPGQVVRRTQTSAAVYGDHTADIGREQVAYGDTGGASRFYYVAKASRAERNAGLGSARSTHPCVKPLALMRWLARLVTPPGGVVLDPFTGSGSTGAACALEGFRFVGVEREPEYVEIARARIAHWEAQATAPAKPKRTPKPRVVPAPPPSAPRPADERQIDLFDRRTA